MGDQQMGRAELKGEREYRGPNNESLDAFRHPLVIHLPLFIEHIIAETGIAAKQLQNPSVTEDPSLFEGPRGPAGTYSRVVDEKGEEFTSPDFARGLNVTYRAFAKWLFEFSLGKAAAKHLFINLQVALKAVLEAALPAAWFIHPLTKQKRLAFKRLPSDPRVSLNSNLAYQIRDQLAVVHMLKYAHLNVCSETIVLTKDSARLASYFLVCKLGDIPAGLRAPDLSSAVDRRGCQSSDDLEAIGAVEARCNVEFKTARLVVSGVLKAFSLAQNPTVSIPTVIEELELPQLDLSTKRREKGKEDGDQIWSGIGPDGAKYAIKRYRHKAVNQFYVPVRQALLKWLTYPPAFPPPKATLQRMARAMVPVGWTDIETEPALVFEWLNEAKDGHSDAPRPFRPSDAVEVEEQMAVLHRLGYVHLDINVRNVMRLDDCAMLIDYDLACPLKHCPVGSIPPESTEHMKSLDPVAREDDEAMFANFLEEAGLRKESDGKFTYTSPPPPAPAAPIPVARPVHPPPAPAPIPTDADYDSLHAAARAGQLDEIKALVARGVNPNDARARARDGTDWTPLHSAVYGNQLAAVKLLVQDYGMPKEVVDANGLTPAFYAKKDDLDAIAVFLDP